MADILCDYCQVVDNLFPVEKVRQKFVIDTRGGSNKCCWSHETLEQGRHHTPASSPPELGALQSHYPPVSSGEYNNISKCLCAVIFHWCCHRIIVGGGEGLWLPGNTSVKMIEYSLPSPTATRPLITAYLGENLKPISLKLRRFTAAGLFNQCTAIKWHQPVTS